jgi:hypothetical protein
VTAAPSKNQLIDKSYLLEYFRQRAEEMQETIKISYGQNQYKERASEINKLLKEIRESIVEYVGEKSKAENWSRAETIDSVLMSTYTSYVVMIDFRNKMWPYDYMTFSRRIGELWEPFCALAWEHPVNTEISFTLPPLFSDVKKKLKSEIHDFTSSLNTSKIEKEVLASYYEKVWTLVTSGEIKLELDLHFTDGKTNFNVDFKSGFSSNEKGNTNRLLLVASIYKIIDDSHKCEIYVRAEEESNNHYLQTLKNSGLWSVYCGAEGYERMEEHTGFGMKKWIKRNISWEDDFDPKTIIHLQKNNLGAYLKW